MGRNLAWKLGLGLGGALTALASDALGAAWLFPVGLGLVVVALVLPAREGQTWGEKWRALVRHLPFARGLRPRSDEPGSDAG